MVGVVCLDLTRCEDCGSLVEPDDGYETIGRCMRYTCPKYNVPIMLK